MGSATALVIRPATEERLGFVVVGRIPEVGTEFGRWLDLVLMQLVLDPARRVGAPEAPRRRTARGSS